jgi:hypothetical protein
MESKSKLSLDQPNMAASTSHEATHAVFNTYELLCNIVGRMPMKDIISATNVSRTWRNALKADIAIQRSVMRIPAPIREIETKLDCAGMRIEDLPSDQFEIVVDINPYMTRICDAPGPWRPHDMTEDHWEMLARKSSTPTPKRPAGAWAATFITQPPVKKVLMMVFPGAQSDRCKLSNFVHYPPVRRSLIKCDGGVTMDKLAAFIRSYRLECGCDVVMKVSLPDGYKSRCDLGAMLPGARRWEVRDGKVCRQIQAAAAAPHLPGSE